MNTQLPDPTDREIKATTLACYAMNMLFGAKLEDFEEINLMELAREFGVVMNDSHAALDRARRVREAAREQEILDLRARIAQLEKRRPWWRFW